MSSKLADTFFDKEIPHWTESDYPYLKHKVDVLQVMLCGNDELLVEYIDKEEDEK